jgi:hypothetical protein
MNRAKLTNWVLRRRCARCGFLGALPLPDGGTPASMGLSDFREVTSIPREQWMSRLEAARRGHKLNGSEYDPRHGPGA